MLLPGRHANTSDYRYGFNGMELDNEAKGEGLQYDYGFRVYDPRLGKFLSRDPLADEYPHYTPYQFAGNTPIQAIDLDGLEEYYYWDGLHKEAKKLSLDLVPIPIDPSHYPDLNGFGLFTTAAMAQRNAENIAYSRERQQQAQVMQESRKALVEYNRLSNPIWMAFELSPFGAAASATENAVEGDYGWAAFDLALGFVEVRGFFNSRMLGDTAWIRSLDKLPISDFAYKTAEQMGEIVERIYKSRNRPSFRKGVVDDVWENAPRDANGNVIDINTGEILTWDKAKSRMGQWDMGHKPGEEWHKLRQEYIDGEKTWQQVLDEYNDPNKYIPENPSSNRSGVHEGAERPTRNQ